MKRFFMLTVTMILATLIASACGNEEQVTNEAEPANVTEGNDEEAQDVDEDEPEEAEETEEDDSETGTGANDFSELIAYMENETEGTAEVLYENNESQEHQLEEVSVSLDAYILVALTDFHTNFSIPFNEQTDGGVIIAKYTVKSGLDKDVYYAPHLYMSFTGAEKAYNNYKDLLPEEEQLPTKLSPSNDYLLEAGETVTGYYAYPFGQDDLETIMDLSTVQVEVPQAQGEKDSFDSPIGKEGKFTLSLSEEGAEKVAANEAFYQDKVTVDDMGEKKMLKEMDGIDESEEIGDVTVALDGYQFTEFIPNSEEAPRFSSFENGIVLLTVKFNLDNKGSEEIGLSSMSSKLTVNDGAQWLLDEGMLLNYGYGDVIDPGNSGELLQVYVLDQEQYDKIWKDKSFEIEIGPIRDPEAKDISKGKKATFTLPEE